MADNNTNKSNKYKYTLVFRHDYDMEDREALTTKPPVVVAMGDPKLALVEQGKACVRWIKGAIGEWMMKYDVLTNSFEVNMDNSCAMVSLLLRNEHNKKQLDETSCFKLVPIHDDAKFLVLLTEDDCIEVIGEEKEFEAAKNMATAHAIEEQFGVKESEEDKNTGTGRILTHYTWVYSIVNIEQYVQQLKTAESAAVNN